ncbi:MAG: Coenzyme F420 hydrogenase/dehydrogenase, beta subunit C-terminal domain [Desulfobacterales bacterium]|jgi:coenzyme F420 hydrogenase subunit beta
MENLQRKILGSNELLEDVHKRELCIGCGACVDICPYFKNYKGKTARLFPCTLEQGRCYAYCPKAEVDLDALSQAIRGVPYDGSPLGDYREVLAARAGGKMKKGAFQSGGTVTALLTFALKTGLIDAAALTDRQALTPVPRIVTDWQDVARCASSKFMAAPTLSSVNLAVRQGYQSIGVVGTPCQMMAVAQMKSNPLAEEAHKVPLSLTVGLFCNWSLDTRQLIDLLSEKLDISGIAGMDIPPPPANILVLDTTGGRVEISLSEIKPLIPHTCFVCPDMTSELADVSVGMFEGRPGWNTLILRSAKGAELIGHARGEGFIETEDFPAQNLKHLSRAAADKKDRSLRTLIRRELINNKGAQRAALRIPQPVVDRILKKK